MPHVKVLHLVSELKAAESASSSWSQPYGGRAVVMTMGALHSGHLSLLDEARRRVGPRGQVVVTIFVNPLQFGDSGDLDRYPKTLVSDVALCEERGADVVFAPSLDDVYPGGDPVITVDPGPVGDLWEGSVRPGHFKGVLTVVLKLLQMTSPDFAVFGEKDYQQLVLIRRMAQDFNISTQIVGAPTQRDPDGLALSSRNAFLSPEDRRSALAIPRALNSAKQLASDGATADQVAAAVANHLETAGIVPDYVLVTDPDMAQAPKLGMARVLVAATVGQIHLLDNVRIELHPQQVGS